MTETEARAELAILDERRHRLLAVLREAHERLSREQCDRVECLTHSVWRVGTPLT